MPYTIQEQEYIYDFITMTEFSCSENNYVILLFDFEFDRNFLHYCLRTALRPLGYKITKKQYRTETVFYYTNIPENIYNEWINWYNENNYSEELSDSDYDSENPEDNENRNQNN
jgi:hypothetical protein